MSISNRRFGIKPPEHDPLVCGINGFACDRCLAEWQKYCPANYDFAAAQDRKRLAPLLKQLQRLYQVFPDEIRAMLVAPVVDIIAAAEGGA